MAAACEPVVLLLAFQMKGLVGLWFCMKTFAPQNAPSSPMQFVFLIRGAFFESDSMGDLKNTVLAPVLLLCSAAAALLLHFTFLFCGNVLVCSYLL